MSAPVALRAEGLTIRIGGRVVVDDVSFTVAAGQCVAIVGESGAGKTLTARALLGLLPAGAERTASVLEIGGRDASRLGERAWRGIRGRRIALVSQDALSALDPLRRIEAEIAEPVLVHERTTREARRARVTGLLGRVSLEDALRRRRPHEISGGQRQRALIASALAARPDVLVADEPTTALDATVQERVLALVRGLTDAGLATILITHDLAAVRRVADRIVVMRAGRIVEEGAADDVLERPAEEYTRALVAASRAGEPPAQEENPTAPDEAPVLDVRGVSKSFGRAGRAVDDVSLRLARGRTLAVVGESGSGKTTLARIVVGVEDADEGEVAIAGHDTDSGHGPKGGGDGSRRGRPAQLVHQDPLAALDPRWRVGRSLAEAFQAAGVPRAERRARVAAALAEVELDPALAVRRPSALSGGQRQRIAIARALAADPALLVLDEPVSALDPSVRARILALLARLQRERGLSMVFITHDLQVVPGVAHEVAVMRDGRIVEHGERGEVFRAPKHPFTVELLRAGRL